MDDVTYRIINYQPDYRSDVLHLLSDLWGQDLILSASYLKWKYLNNPYLDFPRIYLAFDNDQLVGVRSFFPSQWKIGSSGKTSLLLADADTVVHKDYRRRGLLTALTNYALKDLLDSPYEYILTLSANRFSAAAVLKMGWINISFIQTAYHSRRSSLPLPRFFGRLNIPFSHLIYRNLSLFNLSGTLEPATSGSTFFNFDRNSKRKNKLVNRNIFSSTKPKPKEMVDLIERIGDERIQHVRDHQFFSWRYQNPRSEYRFLYMGMDSLDGYLVLRGRLNQEDGEVVVADWEAINIDKSEQLLKAAIEWGNFFKLTLWSQTLSREKKQLLHKFGFQFSDYKEEEDSQHFPPLVLFKPIQKSSVDTYIQINNQDMLDLGNWDLRAIYSDGY
jgi:GNAT superfamily N-acetyltransferase